MNVPHPVLFCGPSIDFAVVNVAKLKCLYATTNVKNSEVDSKLFCEPIYKKNLHYALSSVNACNVNFPKSQLQELKTEGIAQVTT
jgi:hypothetical protein